MGVGFSSFSNQFLFLNRLLCLLTNFYFVVSIIAFPKTFVNRLAISCYGDILGDEVIKVDITDHVHTLYSVVIPKGACESFRSCPEFGEWKTQTDAAEDVLLGIETEETAIISRCPCVGCELCIPDSMAEG